MEASQLSTGLFKKPKILSKTLRYSLREEFPSIAACQNSVEEAGFIWQSSSQASFHLETDLSQLGHSFLMQGLFNLWSHGSSNITNMFESALKQNDNAKLDISVELGVFSAHKA